MARFTGGWIKLWRKAVEGDLASHPFLWALWNWLLFAAVWKPTSIRWKGMRRDIPPGTVVMGIREIADKWDCSPATVKRWLDYLVESRRITLESGTDGTLVTILNWSVYQASDDTRQTPAEHELNETRTGAERDLNLSEEGKNLRREEEIHTVRSRAPSFDLESVYRKYPRKKGKTPGMKKLKTDIKTPEDLQNLEKAIVRYCQSPDVQRGYVMNFDTFARQWRDWLDEDAGTSTVEADSGINWEQVFNKGGAA